jgi:acetylornithine deacetylase/succinyl-diaminopimelate desuccinylase-like protein
VVYADWLHAPGRPTVLIYGHYDTQPVDPLELWSSPPFSPEVRDGRIYARGATDDKGNLLIPILAVEALLRTAGALPLNVKLLCEGEEEIGSPHLEPFLASTAGLLACDLALCADASQWREDQPALGMGCRGLCGVQVDVQGANSDLHSGTYGGLVPNPIHALVQILASLHNDAGQVAVAGFYDDVAPLSAFDRQRIAEVPFEEAAYRERQGVSALVGEAGYTPLERLWVRPTLEVNGLWGGFQGDGVKTVLPNQAHAKITCRLVANQEPERVAALLSAHVRQHTPPGVSVTVQPFGGGARAYELPADHPANRAAAAVLSALYGKTPYYARTGGTVPFLGLFWKHLGVHTVDFGFGLDDESTHAPNEFFRLSSFRRGQRAYGLLLEELARQGL